MPLLNSRSRISLWVNLLLLVLSTVICGQLRFIETGTAYWRDRDLAELGTWRRHQNTEFPKLVSNDENNPVLEFNLYDHRQAMAIKTWIADGTELIKVRIRHRSTKAITTAPDQKLDPISVTVSGLDENNHLILDRVGHIVVGSTTDSWKTSEAIMPLSKEARKFSFAIVATGSSGNFQISDLDIVQVKQADWFTVPALMLWALWALWFYQAVHPHQSFKLVSLVTSLWILGWAGYLVFPRTIDIPRPFLTQFWMAAQSEVPQEAPQADQPEKAPVTLKKTGPQPKAEKPPTDSARKWFKSFGGGRFLMHFGVMGVFAGGLLLLLPLRNAWPFLLAMVIGIELLPALLIDNADRDDLGDLLAYILAIIISIPAAGRVRKQFPRLVSRFARS